MPQIIRYDRAWIPLYKHNPSRFGWFFRVVPAHQFLVLGFSELDKPFKGGVGRNRASHTPGRNSFDLRNLRRCYFRKMLLLFPQSFSFLGQFLDKIILSVACPSRQTTNTRLKTCAFVAKRLYCFLAHPLLGLLLGKLDSPFCLY